MAITPAEIAETRGMVEEQNLDIRTITMGVSLMGCGDENLDRMCTKIYDHVTHTAEHLVETAENLEREYGIPIVNKRVSVTPVAQIAACCKDEDLTPIAHALDRAAETLGIEHHVVDLTERFATEVKAQTLAGIEAGRYPFPCSICTPGLKIPALFECAREYGCDKVATGHYARITTDEEFGVGLLDYQLRVPFDKHKDQTYLLYRLTQEQLSRLIFPLADIHKGVVRRMAMQHGVMQFAPVEDGQGTPCFFGDDSFADWLEGEGGIVPAKKVDVIDTTGAGDAFFAGTVIGLTYGKTLAESCEIGSRLAASVICITENVCPRFRPLEFGLDIPVVD